MAIYLIYKIVLSSIIATLFMTFFSYKISDDFKELYKEPVLLTFFLHKLKRSVPVKTKELLAWILHFTIGFLFVLAYHIMWYNSILKQTWESGILLGICSGFLGILGWMFIFDYTNHQPKIDFKGYYIQLFIAHIIFGLVAFFAYKNL